jgi:hypothetical protein
MNVQRYVGKKVLGVMFKYEEVCNIVLGNEFRDVGCDV